MPIVFVNLLQTTGTKGGIEVYARELYRHLGSLDSGFDFVAFASRELMSQDHSWFPGQVIDSGISGEGRLGWARGELFAVSRAAKSAGADLIHGPAMFGPLRSTVPVVITVHDLLYFTHPELMKTKLFTGPVKWMEKRGAANATRLIAISEHTASMIQRHLPFPADHIDVVLQAGRELPAATQIESAEREPDLFVAIGQRSPYKDFETILRGWATLAPDDRPRLVITGSHRDDPLRPLVHSLGLEHSVELRSWVPAEELAVLFTTATAFIDATLAAGFGLPALEAMTVGLPVILADTAVFREVAGSAADYFHPGDPIDLARAVTELANDRAHQAALTELGRTRAARFSWRKTAVETIESFERAIAEGKRTRARR